MRHILLWNRLHRFAGDALRTFRELLYPNGCCACSRELPGDDYLCTDCTKELPRLTPPYCLICSEPFPGDIENPFACANCGRRRFEFDCAVPACLSRGNVRDLIHRFKYSGEFHLRHPLAEILASALEDKRLSGFAFDAIVPVPLHPSRRRERRFNQAEELAQLLSKRTGRPLHTPLIRIRNTRTQTGFDRNGRMENLRNAFRLRQTTSMHGMKLLLVDDVFTTGSTTAECARLLVKAGADSVRVATVARG